MVSAEVMLQNWFTGRENVRTFVFVATDISSVVYFVSDNRNRHPYTSEIIANYELKSAEWAVIVFIELHKRFEKNIK